MSSPRLLVVRIGAMGDVLHALPAVAGLRARWPEATIDWVIDRRWASLLRCEQAGRPVVSTIFEADTRLWSRRPLSRDTLRSVLALRQALREKPYDFVVDMQGTLRSAVVGGFARTASFAGYTDPRERMARSFYTSKLPRRGTHVVAQGEALLGEATGLLLEVVAPQLPCFAEAELWAEDIFNPFRRPEKVALLAPTAGWGAKQWPAPCFGDLARRLAASGWHVLINAATQHDPVGLKVMEESHGTATLVTSDLMQLLSLTRRVSAVVGGDSGPVHLAALMGRPLVALFGPTDPARNGPWGPGPKQVLRHQDSATSHKRVAKVDPGLAQISVTQVLKAVVSVTAP